MFGIFLGDGSGHKPHPQWGHISHEEARPDSHHRHSYHSMSFAPLGSPPHAQTNLSAYTQQPSLYPLDISQTANYVYSMHSSSPDGSLYGENGEYPSSSSKALGRKASRSTLLGRAVRRSLSYGAATSTSEEASDYKEHRTSRHRRKSSALDDKWSDDVKAAFIDACMVVPKIGKGKKFLNGKMCGRNELISDHIEKLTGKYRCRKQVSSHIQVLKNRHKDKPEILQLLSSTPPGVDESSPASSPDREELWPPMYYKSGSPSAQSDLSLNSRTPSRSKRSTTSAPVDFEYLNQPTTFAQTSSLAAPFQTSGPKVYPSAFRMWVSTEPVISGQLESCVHTYSSLSQDDSYRHSPISLMSVPSWASRFPVVAELYEKNEITSSCTLLLFSVSVEMPTNPPPPKSVFCTQFEIKVPDSFSGNIFETRKWECVTRIYAPDQKVWEFSHNVPVSEDLDNAFGTKKLSLPFASDFWSAFYSNILEAQVPGNSAYRRREKEAKAAMKGVTVAQEVFFYSTSRVEAKTRAALIMFEFSKTETGQNTTAVWREIISPAAAPNDLGGSLTTNFQQQPGFLTSNDSWAQSTTPPSYSRFSPGHNIPIGIYDDLSPSASFYNSYNSSFADDIGIHSQQPQTIAPVEMFYGHPPPGSDFASPFLMPQDGEVDDCAMSAISHDDDAGFWKEER